MAYRKLMIGAISALVATGCSTAVVDRAEETAKAEREEVSSEMERKGRFGGDVLEVEDSKWFGGTAYKLNERDRVPSFFSDPAPFSQADPIPFPEIMTTIGREYGVRIDLSSDAIAYLGGDPEDISSGEDAPPSPLSGPGFSDSTDVPAPGGSGEGEGEGGDADTGGGGANPTMPLTLAESGIPGDSVRIALDHEGDLGGLLDRVTSRANLHWRWERDRIVVFRHDTKTFTLDLLPGTSSFSSEVRSAVQPSSEGDDNASTLSQHETSIEAEPESAFGSVRETVESLLSNTGSYSVTEKTGTVTVTDTPDVLEKVTEYVESINEISTQRIAVRTEVYDIELDEQGSAGIDWNAVYNQAGDMSDSLRAALETSFNGNSTDSPVSGEVEVIDPSSPWMGSQAFLNLMGEYADISLKTTSTVYTVNGEPVPVQVVDKQSYLAAVESEVTENGTSFALDPGVVTSGITMNVLPRRLSDGDVLMQMVMDISQLNGIEEFSAGDSALQLPNQSTKNFLQRVILDSGEPLMISGFERTENRSETRSFGGRDSWMAGGNRSGGERRVMTMVVITPYLISDR